MTARRALLAMPLLGGCAPTDLATVLTPRAGASEARGLRYGAGPRQALDLTMPAQPPRALVVFLYGGGWDSGERGRYRFLTRTLAARGLAAAVPDYRLWPAARWPDFLEDAALAVHWLRARPAMPAVPLFLMGHSAGAFMAMALALDPRWLGAGRAALAGAVGLAGVYDFQPLDETLASIFGRAPDGRIRAAPDDAALRDAPPTLLLHGESDTTVRPGQSRRLAARLAAADRPAVLRLYPGVGHLGILAAVAAPVRALGLAGAPVLADVLEFIGAVRDRGDEPGRAAAVVPP